jgi:AMP-polyphosphate phosphotransferase
MHPRLRDADLGKTLRKKIYKKRTKENQVHLVKLQRDVIKHRVPVVIVFEGWDASGKGGTIRRLVKNLDPRIYRVEAISKPTPEELSHQYLWRFWTKLPRRGQIVVFDRSWYGRVLVERVEGFARDDEWKRAYDEINHFEKALVDDGCILIKFFLHISKDEQRQRFAAREKNPLKQWKMNAEDYRNRKRWDDYMAAIDDMFAKTHSRQAPWILVPANDKRMARILCQDRLLAALERTSKKQSH